MHTHPWCLSAWHNRLLAIATIVGIVEKPAGGEGQKTTWMAVLGEVMNGKR